MLRNTSRPSRLCRMLTATAFATGLHVAMLGALMNQPSRGDPLSIAQHPVTVPVMVGTISFRALKTGFFASFAHAARDLRHAERNVLRSIHHGARTAAALVSWSGTPANAASTC